MAVISSREIVRIPTIITEKGFSVFCVVVSVVSGGENGGHEMRTSHGRIFIQNRDPLDH